MKFLPVPIRRMMPQALSHKFCSILSALSLMACSDMPSRSSSMDSSPPKTLIRALVKADGTASEIKVMESSGSEKIDRIALDRVKGARYRPYSKNGVPEDAWVLIPVTVKAQ